MSLSKIKKSTEKLALDVNNNDSLKRKPIIISDSKGRYIQDQITTEQSLGIKFISKKGWKIQSCIDWVEDNLKYYRSTTAGKHIVCIWLGTCDLTDLNKKSRLLTLNANNDSNVRYLRRKFIELKQIIKNILPSTKVIILEVPTFSIQRWNVNRGRPNSDEFIEQDESLWSQIEQLNEYIRELNRGSTPSPKFNQDLLRGTKGRNQKAEIDYYYNLNLYREDGVHPKPALAKLWMTTIANSIVKSCR